MSEKRKDKRGRILRNGECQRKDGLYQFEYVDPTGTTKFLYSWKLEPTDTLPKGKRRCLSLREKEREIQRCIEDGIIPNGGNLTVCELVKRYTLQKHGVRESTRTGYQTVINMLSKDAFGAKRIDKVKLSDARIWLIQLQYLMGHSEIGVTLDVYTHLGLEDAAEELHRMEELHSARQEMNRTKNQAI